MKESGNEPYACYHCLLSLLPTVEHVLSLLPTLEELIALGCLCILVFCFINFREPPCCKKPNDKKPNEGTCHLRGGGPKRKRSENVFTDNIIKGIGDCRYCGASLFETESSTLCCRNGKCAINPGGSVLTPLPQGVTTIYQSHTQNNQDHYTFSQKARFFNNLVSFSSIGIYPNEGKQMHYPGYPSMLHTQGSIYHHLKPASMTNSPISWYIADPQARYACARINHLNEWTIQKLMELLERHNPLAKYFQALRQQFDGEVPNGILRFEWSAESSEIAVCLCMDNNIISGNRVICLRTKAQPHEQILINSLHALYEPLRYPFFFVGTGDGAMI